jgi:hypothetical protein
MMSLEITNDNTSNNVGEVSFENTVLNSQYFK